jgi:2-Cys peroxiredoxin 5
MSSLVGFQIPSNITLHEDNPGKEVVSGDIFTGKKIVLFGVPGAFTPGCSGTHLPGYINDYDKFMAKGVNDIVCISVNDAFVCGAWKEAAAATGKVRILADPNAEFTKVVSRQFILHCRFSNLIDYNRPSV